ncbi:competence protein ComK [Sporosarcina sp. ACRSL]|uniref:competence protein ComK n=1 Tax=Sporosarcina sp. ACRSL TaxID=2918215 RepID=UPI001EF43EC8|nr:competence protein ComK [Sporosarcina sp. ACRSL]MCG7344041.1 competence protein ComK [Sporosarcina sp. ACRSL]
MRDDSLLLDFRALALRPVFSGTYLSEIITTHGVYYSRTSPVELLKQACLRHHSSKEGRKDAAKKLLNYHKKPPFLISDDVGVFPTVSSDNPECIYIFSHFFKAEKVGKAKTKITFSNKTVITVPVSHYTVMQQKAKLHMLLSHSHQSKRNYISGQPYFGMEPDLPIQHFN